MNRYRTGNRIRTVLFALVVLCLCGGMVTPSAHGACVTVWYYDSMDRTSGNAIAGYVENSLSGPCMLSWYPGVTGWVYKGSQQLQSSGAERWGSAGGIVSYEFPALSLSQYGPGTYTVNGFFRAYCPTCNSGLGQWAPPYEDGWDGWDSSSHTVQRPAISGFGSGGAMWYLGPGTDSQVLAQDGHYYYQRYTLNFNSNCDPAGACTETPYWTLTTAPGVPQQAYLSSSSGQSVTITSGPNTGNCQWSTTVKVSIGGFESEPQQFAVNSPSHLVSQGALNITLSYYGGYVSQVYWAVADTCTPAQALIGLPLHEGFGTFSNPGVVSGWPDPPPLGAATFNFPSNMYIFFDSIGAAASAGVPSPVYTSPNPPFTYNTRLKYAPQNWRVGTATLGPGGTQVFSGTIEYYRDHGKSQ